MDLKRCIDFANENKLSFLATSEGDQPRVRALGFWFADETGFYFQIGGMKPLHGQLKRNPKVEACFYHHDPKMGSMLRVSGSMEFVNDRALKERVLQERPFLKSFGLTNPDHPDLVIFRIPHGEAHIWTMENNLKPKEIVKF